MQSIFAASLILGRGGYPWVAVFTMLAIILFQLFSGKLIGLRWETWITRKDHPRKFWTVLTIEGAIVLTFLFIGGLTL
jgi:hypothetical protein